MLDLDIIEEERGRVPSSIRHTRKNTPSMGNSGGYINFNEYGSSGGFHPENMVHMNYPRAAIGDPYSGQQGLHMGHTPIASLMDNYPRKNDGISTYQSPLHQPFTMETYSDSRGKPVSLAETETPSVDCRTVAEHISECPVCGKLYKNDNTICIIIIITLLVICLLMGKKILCL